MKRMAKARTSATTRAPSRATTTKRSAAKPASTTRAKPAAQMSDKQLIELARKAVPKKNLGRARVVRHENGPAMARTGGRRGETTAEQVAKLVGAKLAPDDVNETTVEFENETPLGKRHTAVHLRSGVVTRVVTRARKP